MDFSGQRAELTNEFEDIKLCIACKAAISNLHTSRVEHQQANKIEGSFQNSWDIFLQLYVEQFETLENEDDLVNKVIIWTPLPVLQAW